MTWSTWDVVVVGAGPAGAVAARTIATAGASTLLLERHATPRDKVCGGCLSAAAVELLGGMGLGHVAAPEGGRTFSAIEVSHGRRRAVLPTPTGRVVRRSVFDAALAHEAISAGAVLLQEAKVVSCDVSDDGAYRIVRTSDGAAMRARCVVVACGIGANRLLREAGLDVRVGRDTKVGAGSFARAAKDVCPAGAIRMVVSREGYVGMARGGDETVTLGAALHPGGIRRAGGVAPMISSIVREAGFDTMGESAMRFSGTGPLTRRCERPAAHRLLVVGDAAGYVEPFTGEGMTWAIASGLGVGAFAVRGARLWDEHIANGWSRWHRRHIVRRQRGCAAVSALVGSYRFGPLAVGALSHARWIGGACARVIHAPYHGALREATA